MTTQENVNDNKQCIVFQDNPDVGNQQTTLKVVVIIMHRSNVNMLIKDKEILAEKQKLRKDGRKNILELKCFDYCSSEILSKV